MLAGTGALGGRPDVGVEELDSNSGVPAAAEPGEVSLLEPGDDTLLSASADAAAASNREWKSCCKLAGELACCARGSSGVVGVTGLWPGGALAVSVWSLRGGVRAVELVLEGEGGSAGRAAHGALGAAVYTAKALFRPWITAACRAWVACACAS